MAVYDTIIVGAGPAGLTAAIYTARSKLKVLVIGKRIGGYMNEAPVIENYPGHNEISGQELAAKIKEQLEKLSIKIKEEEVKEIKKVDKKFQVSTNGNKYISKTIILACGSMRKKLNIPGEQEFLGKGVSYCFECDAPFFKNKDIVVIGGGNSAVVASLYMLRHAKKVYMISRSKPRAERIRIEKLLMEGKNKVRIISGYNVIRINGDKTIKEIEIQDVKTKKRKKIGVQGVIIEIGMIPCSYFAKELGASCDEAGYIQVDSDMVTDVAGLFAAGDIINRELKQIITAAAYGAIAAKSVYDYLQG